MAGCLGEFYSRGWCKPHYNRWRKYGTPNGGRNGPRFTESRFWSKVQRGNDEECWRWDGSYFREGYGQFYAQQLKTTYAHRISYMLIKGPIAAGMVIDHLCRNRWCVNPSHLEAVTNHVNILRGWEARAAT